MQPSSVLPGTRILEEVAQTGIALLLREPFYAHLLGGINKEVVGKGHPVDSLAVGLAGSRLTLFVNADFWDGELENPQFRVGVLKHEMLHLVFRHISIDQQFYDPMLLNLAFDLVVNQYVDRAMLPPDSIFLDSFPDLRLEKGQTWYYYYRKLDKLKKEAAGSSSGTPSEEMLEKIRSDSHGMERHQPWREIKSNSELERKAVDLHQESLLRTAHQRTSSSAWGSMPGDVKEQLKDLLIPNSGSLNWRVVLRIFASSAASTKLQNTIRRLSKRYGTSPGIRIKRRKRLLVALDTSGSIGKEEFEQFFREIHQLWRSGASITLIESDTKVYREYPYKGRVPELVYGRGGTDFTDALHFSNRFRPDALIFFTDGFADTPKVRLIAPVLWVISIKGIEKGQETWRRLPGRKVKIT